MLSLLKINNSDLCGPIKELIPLFLLFLNGECKLLFIWFSAVFSQFVKSDSTLLTNSILVITASAIDCIWYILVAIIVTSYGLKDFFQNADLKSHPMKNKDIDNLITKLKMWGKELRVRQLYYDI